MVVGEAGCARPGDARPQVGNGGRRVANLDIEGRLHVAGNRARDGDCGFEANRPIAFCATRFGESCVVGLLCFKPALVKKGLYLYFWVKTNMYIAQKDTFNELIARASSIITTLRVDDNFLETSGLTREGIALAGIHADDAMEWVELALRTAIDVL